MASEKNDEIFLLYKENKDVQTRNKIFEMYSHIVRIIAARIYPAYKSIADFDDLMSAGSLALLTKRKNSREFFLILTVLTVQGA